MRFEEFYYKNKEKISSITFELFGSYELRDEVGRIAFFDGEEEMAIACFPAKEVKEFLGAQEMLNLLKEKCKVFTNLCSVKDLDRFPSPAELIDYAGPEKLEMLLEFFLGEMVYTEWVYHLGFNPKYGVDTQALFDTWEKAFQRSYYRSHCKEDYVEVKLDVFFGLRDLVEAAFSESDKSVDLFSRVLDKLQKDKGVMDELGTDRDHFPTQFLGAVDCEDIFTEEEQAEYVDGYVFIPCVVCINKKLVQML